MISVLVSGSSSLGSSSGWGHCVVFLGKRLNFHSASPHPGVQMGTGKLDAGVNTAIDVHPIQVEGDVEILSSLSMLRKPGYFSSLISRRHLTRMQTSPSTDIKETYKSWQNYMSTACTIRLSYPIMIKPKNKNIRNKIRIKGSIKHGKRIF